MFEIRIKRIRIRKTIRKIKKSDLIFAFVMISFLQPPVFSYFPLFDNAFLVMKIISSLYALYYMFFKCKSFSWMQGLMTVFWLTIVLSTFLNGGDILQAIRTIAINLISILFLDSVLRVESKKIIRVLRVLCVAFTIINLLLLFVFHDGFDRFIPGYSITDDTRINFLGRDNSLIYFFIFALVIEFLASESKVATYFFVAVILFTMIFVWSGTGVIGCLLICIFSLFIQGKKIEKIFKFIFLSIVYILVYLGVVIFRMQDIFSEIIVNDLHKDVTFTGRTALWDLAMQYIAKKPWFGYGIREKFLTMESGISYSPHNFILQLLLAGGIVSLVCFLIIYFYSGKKLSNQFKFSNFIAFAIFTYMIASLTESTMNSMFLYYILVLGCNISIIEKEKRLNL